LKGRPHTRLALLSILLLCAAGRAQTPPDPNGTVSILLASPAPLSLSSQEESATPKLAPTSAEQLDVVYNPEELPVEPRDLADASVELAGFNAKSIADEALQIQDNNKYYVPIGPSKPELLMILRSLKSDEIPLFLAKKQRFLETRMSGWMQWLHLPRKLHNTLLSAMNDQIYESAHVFAQANKYGVQVRLTVAFGLGLGNRYAAKFRATRLGKVLPNLEGFAVVTSLGFQISKKTTAEHETWELNFFGAHANQASIGPFGLALISGGIVAGPVVEFEASDHQPRMQEYDLNHPGPINVQRSKSRLSMIFATPVTDLSLPPFLGGLFFYQLKEHVLTAVRLRWRKPVTGSVEGLCRSSLSR